MEYKYDLNSLTHRVERQDNDLLHLGGLPSTVLGLYLDNRSSLTESHNH
jgi:hypothetical protein